ncbi:hypothetical protein HispidOSU_029185, partial [Sigmodon hispidus]
TKSAIPKGMAFVPMVTSEQRLIPRQKDEKLLDAMDILLCDKVYHMQNQEQSRCVDKAVSFASVLKSPGKFLWLFQALDFSKTW